MYVVVSCLSHYYATNKKLQQFEENCYEQILNGFNAHFVSAILVVYNSTI